MKRFMTIALALILIAGILSVGPAEAKKRVIPGSTIADLLVATSAVLDTGLVFDVSGYDYVGLVCQIDSDTLGASGAGFFYIQGSTEAGVWEKVRFINLSDSCVVTDTVVLSGTGDIQKSVVLCLPYDLKDGANATPDGVFIGNYLPYEKLRFIISDTNWNTRAEVDFYWIVE